MNVCEYVKVYGCCVCLCMSNEYVCEHMCMGVYVGLFVCVSMCIFEYMSESMCMFLCLDFEGRDCVLLILTPPASSPMSLSYSINFCWIMNENKRISYLVKASYMSIPFPFQISNLGSEFASKFFKCYCGGYMEGANSFGVQAPCGVNIFFYPCELTLLGRNFFGYFKKVTCNYDNYSPEIGFVCHSGNYRFLVIFSCFKSKQIT